MDFEESVLVVQQVIKKLEKRGIGSEVLGEDLWEKFREAFRAA
jgi:hypothetical protein